MQGDLFIKEVAIRFSSFSVSANFTVRAGERWVLSGPSGCGKTTLLRAIAGFEAYEGQILWNEKGSELNLKYHSPEKRNFGYLFQEPYFFNHLSVIENLALPLKWRGVQRTEREVLGLEWLNRVELAHLEKRSIEKLSGGEKARLSLARAIIGHPRLLLLDEPFRALEPRLREEMQTLVVKTLSKFNMPALWVTHDLIEAKAVATHHVEAKPMAAPEKKEVGQEFSYRFALD